MYVCVWIMYICAQSVDKLYIYPPGPHEAVIPSPTTPYLPFEILVFNNSTKLSIQKDKSDTLPQVRYLHIHVCLMIQFL